MAEYPVHIFDTRVSVSNLNIGVRILAQDDFFCPP